MFLSRSSCLHACLDVLSLQFLCFLFNHRFLVLKSSIVTRRNTYLLEYIKVIEAATKLNISINVSQVGSDTPSVPTAANASPIDRSNDWKPAFAVDEDGLLHQLRATLVQVYEACMLNCL